MMKARKHAEVIKAWADGLPIQYNSRGMWEDFDSKYDPNWKSDSVQWRVKPAEPAHLVTRMTTEEFQKLLVQNRGLCESVVMARIVADAALRHACDAGQVVPREEFDRAVGDRKARDMAVAKQVVKTMCWAFGSTLDPRFDEEYLQTVIDRVSP